MFVSLQDIERISYSQRINTLRAVSVLGVIFYHFEYQIVQGGWLGVDIFFVISGYLISNIIFSEINENKFKFKNFFIRRIKRILPSFYLTSLVSLIVGYFTLNKPLLIQLSESVLSSIFFVSNIYFSNLDFYTAGGASKIFLLNYWSLSVEEQFYLVFPIFIFLGYKFKNKKFLVFLLFFIAFISLYANTLGNPNKFYFLQFRAWEFLFGVFCNFIKDFKLRFISKLSLLVLIASFFVFDKSDVIQTEPKLLVAIFTILFIKNIYGNEFKWINSSTILSQIGTASYTIYLIHYPIYYIYKHFLEINFKTPTQTQKIILLIIIFIFSVIIYEKFEKKFINDFTPKRKLLLLILVFVNLFIISLFISTNFLNNYKYKNVDSKVYEYSLQENFHPVLNNEKCHNRDIDNICNFKSESTQGKSIYFIGDSQMLNLSYTVINDEKYSEYSKIIYSKNGCIPIYVNNTCPDKASGEVKSFLNNISNSTIVYGGRIPLYISDGKFFNGTLTQHDAEFHKRDIEQFIETINIFLSNNNKVFFLFSVPNQGWNVTDLYLNQKYEFGEVVGYEFEYWYKKIESLIIEVNKINDSNFYPLNSYELFCKNIIENFCVAAHDQYIYYSDYIHLTSDGSNLVLETLIQNLNK